MINSNVTSHHGMLFKVVIVGESGVGKSTISKQYADGVFEQSLLKTIDFNVKIINNEGILYKMQIWDTAGQERFRNITHSCYRGSHGMILVFDLTNQRSFDLLHHRLNDIKKYVSQNTPIILVGNKCQCHELIKISKQQIQLFCSSNNLTYVQTSAKNNTNIDYIFQSLVKKMIINRNNSQSHQQSFKKYQHHEEKLENKQIKHNFIFSKLPIFLFITLLVLAFIIKI